MKVYMENLSGLFVHRLTIHRLAREFLLSAQKFMRI